MEWLDNYKQKERDKQEAFYEKKLNFTDDEYNKYNYRCFQVIGSIIMFIIIMAIFYPEPLYPLDVMNNQWASKGLMFFSAISFIIIQGSIDEIRWLRKKIKSGDDMATWAMAGESDISKYEDPDGQYSHTVPLAYNSPESDMEELDG